MLQQHLSHSFFFALARKQCRLALTARQLHEIPVIYSQSQFVGLMRRQRDNVKRKKKAKTIQQMCGPSPGNPFFALFD
jgi:hypothetical protein